MKHVRERAGEMTVSGRLWDTDQRGQIVPFAVCLRYMQGALLHRLGGNLQNRAVNR